MIRVAISIALAGLLSSACMSGKDDSGAVPPLESCGGNALIHWVGEAVSDVEIASLSQPVRLIRPGDMVTRDYRRERLNVELDENETILRLWCG